MEASLKQVFVCQRFAQTEHLASLPKEPHLLWSAVSRYRCFGTSNDFKEMSLPKQSFQPCFKFEALLDVSVQAAGLTESILQSSCAFPEHMTGKL